MKHLLVLLIALIATPTAADTEDIVYKTTEASLLRPDLHYPIAADPQAKLAAYREVSPVNCLNANSPPLLIIQGDKDTTIPVHHANYMKEKASAAKAPVEILIVRNAGHNWREIDAPIQPSIDDIAARTAAFLKQHLDISPRK